MVRWLRKRRRTKLAAEPLPEAWRGILEALPIWKRLPAPDREELARHVRIFLAEKPFEACGGLGITDQIRVTVAAYGCLLLLHRETDYYPQLASILVYPAAYDAPAARHVGEYLVEEGTEIREGESWYRGAMVLSWEDVKRGIANPESGENVVLHEFAHQLDDESGDADGTPALTHRRLWHRWVAVCEREYEALIEADERGRRTLLDPYGAESPSEFFAVVTECFFERPAKLEARHPELYQVFSEFYRQDPARW
jgi:hypothetical protein